MHADDQATPLPDPTTPSRAADASPGALASQAPDGGAAAHDNGTPADGVTPQARDGDAPEPRDDDAAAGAEALERLAATVERLRREAERARREAADQALIELAKGVLLERLRCGPAHAAEQLAILAAKAGVSRLEVAADIVNEVAGDRIGAAAEADPEVSVRLRAAESAALGADDTQVVAVALLEHALTPLGATAVAVWAAEPGAALTLVGCAGFGHEEARRWRHVPPGVVTPAGRSLTERRTIWHADTGLPAIGRLVAGGGRVTVPMTANGRVLGVLEICWPHALPPHPPRLERQIEAMAELCAHTLDTPFAAPSPSSPALSELVDLADALPDPALVLQAHLDVGDEPVDFRIRHVNERITGGDGLLLEAFPLVPGGLLLEAYPRAAGGLFERLLQVHATGKPFRAARMTLGLSATGVADVSLTRHGDSVLMVWRAHDEDARLAGLLEHAQRLGRIGGFEENAVTGQVTWNAQLYSLYGMAPGDRPIPLERLRDHAHPDDEIAIGRFLRTVLHHRRFAAVAFRLVRPDGVSRHMRVVAEPVFGPEGRLMAVRGAYQDISSQHWTEVALSVTRDQLAHTEQRSAASNRLALQLQQAIMPPSHGTMESLGLHIAVRYRPAQKEDLVGGDWYDAVALPSQRVLLSVGDVAGHGVEAATGMVILRNALRGLATTGAGPAQLMSWLNQVAHHLADRMTATAVCALYDPPTRELRWARAGHLPPILLREGAGSELPMVRGPLLGAFTDAQYEEGRLQLRAEDTLLMYTDGLIERRDHNLRHAQDQLLTIARRAAATLDHRLDDLLTHCNSDTDDDTCLIGVHLS
ncbi:SpoIIE family protein phosphatase [Nonomuraea gerenzanensis]|uniref:Serine phosphatase RsbU, regulator of sigma subunit n=1 Tax=Nonomuraea gerenzanensis TaxID=93944 RepID=A0A1M4E8N7_9ACTN|nr:SpoIIE family protein phosphatase [Nonomuraea gerenzanensis]UBU17430.1 SpoIIE family protein phosphatase [Nonomuraea gerenzanensis]SBO95185.1 Serine phosphatase RsbU, regulator of sigma subunit [Nonomuraea gerenzanensis]